MRRSIALSVAFATALAASLGGRAEARTKLVALPDRETTIIRLDNPAATLVEEERTLNLQKGLNQVDFSWRGVSVDPFSIRITILDHPDKVRLLNVQYPPGEGALVWEIGSDSAFQERVRISYLLSGIDRLVEYRAVTAKDESALDLYSYLILRNFSGEDFRKVRLQIDEGASIERETLNGETKRALFFNAPKLPIEKTLTWDSAERPWEPEKADSAVGIPFQYRVANAKIAGLGTQALWGGKARVFQDDGHGSQIFVGEDNVAFTPIDEKFRLSLGESRDVVVTQKTEKEEQVNIRRNNAGRTVLYDDDVTLSIAVENFKDQPVTLELIEHLGHPWEVTSSTQPYERRDADTLVYTLKLGAKEKVKISCRVLHRNLRG